SGGRGFAVVIAPSPYCCPSAFSKLHPQQKSWSLPTQMRTETRPKFELSIRTRRFPVLCREFPVHSKKFPCLFHQAIQFRHGLALSVFTCHRNLAHAA